MSLAQLRPIRKLYRVARGWTPKSFLFGAVIAGIIGSAAFWLIAQTVALVVESARSSVTVSIPLAISIFLFPILAFAIAYRRFQRILNGAEALADLDQTLLGLLPQLAPSKDRTAAMVKLLQAFLRDLIEVIGDDLVFRAIIYRIDGDRLVPWVVWPDEYHASVAKEAFYVGPDDKTKRGTAGEVFCASGAASRVVHVSKGKDGWTADDPSWEPPASGTKPRYRSFIASKIFGTVEPSPWGIISIDSQYDDTFDSKEVRDLVETMSIRLDSAMLLYRSLGGPGAS